MEEKKELWMVQTKRADFSGLAMRLGVSPVAVRVMRNLTDNGMNPGDSSCRHLLPITRLLTMMQHLLLSKRMQESSWLLFRRKRFSHFLMSVQQKS